MSRLLCRILVVGGGLLLPGRLLAQLPNINDYTLVADTSIQVGALCVVASGNVGINSSGGLLVSKQELQSGDGTHIVADIAHIGNPASMYSLYANQTVLGPQVIIRIPGEPLQWAPPLFQPDGFPTPPAVTSAWL